MDFLSINAKTTRTSDIIFSSTSYLGPSFSGFANLKIDIGPESCGTLNLGNRNLFYENISHWMFRDGTYTINGTAKPYEALDVGRNANVTVTGGSGSDLFVFEADVDKQSLTITDFSYKDDQICYRPGGTFYPYPATLDSAVKLASNLKIVHAGSGADARTKITAYGPQSSTYCDLVVNGHYELDGIDVGQSDNAFMLSLKPATALKYGDIGATSGGAGNNGSSSGGSGGSTAGSYMLAASSVSVSEGANATFLVSSNGVSPGAAIPYTLSGVSASDMVGGSLSGSAIIDTSGKATISIGLNPDATTEGNETLTVNAGGKTASILINDTSIGAAMTATYTLLSNAATVNEGSTAKFTLSGTNTTPGAVVPYVISGVSAEDLGTSEVSGRVKLDDLGMATISIPVAADMVTEGNEIMAVTVGGQVATITINDTSKSGSEYYISASDGLVSEGKVATFMVSAANAVAGTKLAYTISGTGINTRDIGNGKLSGSVSAGSDSSAIIVRRQHV